MKKFLMFFCLFSWPVFFTIAAESVSGWGRVNMQGSIIDTACAIAFDSREQTIDMGSVPLASIIRTGQGSSKPFSIHLINCSTKRSKLNKWKDFNVTFDGESDGDNFGVKGDASGVALQISDIIGNVAIPGKSLPLLPVEDGNKTLDYYFTLVSNSKSLKPGDYFSSIRFKIDYF